MIMVRCTTWGRKEGDLGYPQAAGAGRPILAQRTVFTRRTARVSFSKESRSNSTISAFSRFTLDHATPDSLGLESSVVHRAARPAQSIPRIWRKENLY